MSEDLDERARRRETRGFYRVPSKGVTPNSKRIAEAVDDEDWQKTRFLMKGTSTMAKIDTLEEYYDKTVAELEGANADERAFEDVKIRIDNYIKALCRGGQLEAGMTFDHFNDGSIRNHIRK